eukprot:Skav228272  [mRNA]  locus=scaffold5658:48586:50484:- [translate_table: standard]
MEQRQRPLPLKGEEMAASQRPDKPGEAAEGEDCFRVRSHEDEGSSVIAAYRPSLEATPAPVLQGWWPAVDDFPVSQVLEMNREDTAEAERLAEWLSGDHQG